MSRNHAIAKSRDRELALAIHEFVVSETLGVVEEWEREALWDGEKVHAIRLYGKRLRAFSEWLAPDRDFGRRWFDPVKDAGYVLAGARRFAVCAKLLLAIVPTLTIRWRASIENVALEWSASQHTCVRASSGVVDAFRLWCEQPVCLKKVDLGRRLKKMARREQKLRCKALDTDSLVIWHKWRRSSKQLGFLNKFLTHEFPAGHGLRAPSLSKRAAHWIGEAHDAADTLAMLSTMAEKPWLDDVRVLLLRHMRDSLQRARKLVRG